MLFDRLLYFILLFIQKHLCLLVFVLAKKKVLNFLYDNLKSQKIATCHDLPNLTYPNTIEKGLIQEFNKLSGQKKFKYISPSEKSTEIDSKKWNIDDGSKFMKDILTPKVSNAKVSTIDFFTRKPRGIDKNQIDPYYMTGINCNYQGILVYFSKDDIALVLEFIKEYKQKTQLVKQDKYGTYWKQHTFSYKDDPGLIVELSKFELSSNKNDIVTYLLDSKSKYNDVSVTPQSSINKTYYTFYTHKNVLRYTSQKSRVILTNQDFKIGNKAYEAHLAEISTYYVKNKEKGEDSQPFLIKFTEAEKSTEKWYHCQKEYKTDNWKQFTHGNDVLNQRLDEFEKDGNCAKEIKDLKEKVIEILEKPLPPKEPAPAEPKEPAPTTPKEPAPTSSPPDIPLIAGSTAGAVGGTAVLGAGGYGYYLYATTIKLLT